MTTLTPDSTPAEVRKAWAERLRNPGDIVQGYQMLAPSANERCCLGVLCDLAVEAGVVDGYEPVGGSPAYDVAMWAGLSEREGGTCVQASSSRSDRPLLSSLNDRLGFTFADIADLLDDGLVLGPDGKVMEA